MGCSSVFYGRARDGPIYANFSAVYNAANHAMSLRKSVMLTTAIAAVFWASDKSDINWIIYLAGWQAWGFLGVAHIYYVVSWKRAGAPKSIGRAFGEPSSSFYHQFASYGGIETQAERINEGVASTG